MTSRQEAAHEGRAAPALHSPTGPTPVVARAEVVTQSRFRRAIPALAALGLALLLAAAAMWPGLSGGPDTIVGNTGDPSIFIWSLQWAPYALAHHLNPLLTDYLHYPGGANLMWNTSIVFPALVLAPVTVWLGPLTSYNVMTVLGMALSGWCAFLAVRRYTDRWVSAAVAGLLYQFSPYMASQIAGHPHLYIAIFPPLLLLLADEILVRQRRPAWLMGGLLGLAAACQLLTGSELLAISAVMAVPALVAMAVVFRPRIRERWPHAWRAGATALVTFLVLAAYPLWLEFVGPLHLSGAALQGTGYVARPTSFLFPSNLELLSGPSTVFDSSVYIGIPMLVLAGGITVWLRRRGVVLVAAFTLACAMVMALGGHLTIHGNPTGVVLPWDIAQHLPVLDNILPVRLMVVGYLALAVLVGVFVDRALRAGVAWRVAGLVAAAAALVPLIPTLPVYSGTYSIPAFFTDGQAAQLPTQGSVLMTPYGWGGYPDLEAYEPEVWQAVSGMGFRTQVGMVFVPGPGGFYWGPDDDPLGAELHKLADLDQPAPTSLSPSIRQTYLGDMRAHEVRAVVIGPSPGEAQVVTFMTELLGRPGESVGGIVVWYDVSASVPS